MHPSRTFDFSLRAAGMARRQCRRPARGGHCRRHPGLMPDVRWEDVAAAFRPDGSVMLVYVEAAGSMAIWQSLADWLSASPGSRYTETGAAGPALPVPAAEEIFERRSRLARPHLQSLSGWAVPGIRSWLAFSEFTPAWLAVSQDAIRSQAELDLLVSAMAAGGRRLGRALSLAREHDIWPGHPVLRYDPVTDAVSRP